MSRAGATAPSFHIAGQPGVGFPRQPGTDENDVRVYLGPGLASCGVQTLRCTTRHARSHTHDMVRVAH